MVLELNKPIKTRNFDYTDKYDQSLKPDLVRVRDSKSWKKGKEIKRKGDRTTDKQEKDYYLWFYYLKLLLEMEKNGLDLIRYRSVKLDKKILDHGRIISQKRVEDRYRVGKDIQIDRDMYSGWELEKVLTQPFYKWWRTHKFLFEEPKTVIIESPKEWKENPNFLYVRIDKRKKYSDLKKDFGIHLENLGLKGKKSTSTGFKIGGNPPYDSLVLKYNVMVRQINGESPLDIFLAEKNRWRILGGKGVIWEGYREWLRNRNKLKEMRQKVGGEEYQRIPKGRKDIYKDLQELILKTPEGKQEGMFSSHIKERITKMVNETQEVLKGVSQGRFYKKIKL